MDYFNKDDIQQLKNLPRSARQKRETMDRIRNRNSKDKRNYPVPYVFTFIAVILLTIIFITSELFSSTENAKEPIESPTPLIDPDENDDDALPTSILNSLENGMSEAEVKQLLGKYYLTGELTTSYVNGESIWRYEIEKSDEYKYEVGGEIANDFLEFEAMNEGNVEMLLFIFWDQQHFVKQYSAIYKDVINEEIYDARVLQNGNVLKQSIFPTENMSTENIKIDLELLKTQFKLGMTMEEVKNLFGSHYKTKVNVDSGTLVWHYDFGKEPNFQFSDKFGWIELEAFEEMKKGKIQATFSINWDVNNLVTQIYGVYLNERENKIYEYGLFPNGYSKDEPIY